MRCSVVYLSNFHQIAFRVKFFFHVNLEIKKNPTFYYNENSSKQNLYFSKIKLGHNNQSSFCQ